MASVEQDREKRAAAARSLDYVQSGQTVGLGSGSTAAMAIELLGERVRQGLAIRGVPTSAPTRRLAEAVGIPLLPLADVTRLDLTIDGADEVDPRLQLIKGGGGALLHEKIVASASERLIIIVDSGKLVGRLGRFALPVEVVPSAWRLLARSSQRSAAPRRFASRPAAATRSSPMKATTFSIARSARSPIRSASPARWPGSRGWSGTACSSTWRAW